ncbi:hypothetical protein [Phaeocystidibacter luteus]|uniref:Tail fiber domain-containing protein n=1 Tax=Phaeocystidibacter luteus TaxID=911197 RepID=A0A6N6RFN9_9FLAO|nr:hypothetical protein [Phaeocystidibacter luteus]KAB2809889.1 hypothetical protein F8C67_08385 [Phaeocystidibacter luteus]
MNSKSTLFGLLILNILSLPVSSQIYTPTGGIDGTSYSSGVGIGGNSPAAALDVFASPSLGAFRIETSSIVDIGFDGTSQSSGSEYALAIDEFLTDNITGGTSISRVFQVNRDGLAFFGNPSLFANPLKINVVGGWQSRVSNGPLFGLYYTTGSTYPSYILDDIHGNILWSFNSPLGTTSHIMKLTASALRVGDVNSSIGMFSVVNPNTTTFASNTGVFIKAGGSSVVSNASLTAFEVQNSSGTSIFKLSANGTIALGGTSRITGNPHYTGVVSISDNLHLAGTEYRLYVQDGIRTESLKVDLVNNWPDYVFNSSHETWNIDYLSNYIHQNGHLPSIPAAEEVQNKGYDVVEMDKDIVETVEQLTLLLLEAYDRIEQLEQQLEVQLKQEP